MTCRAQVGRTIEFSLAAPGPCCCTRRPIAIGVTGRGDLRTSDLAVYRAQIIEFFELPIVQKTSEDL